MANVTFNITVATTDLTYTPATGNPNTIRTTWELSYQSEAAAIATACALTAGTTVTVADQGNPDRTGEMAAKAAHTKVDGNLSSTALKIDLNAAAYRPGGGGSHGGSTTLIDRLASTQIEHAITIGGTTYTVRPGVKINVVPVAVRARGAKA